MEKNVLKGALLVGLGASSYGALATVVKLAYEKGFTTAQVSTAQFSIGLAVMLLLQLLFKTSATAQKETTSRYSILKLMIGGTSLGLDRKSVV